ncbi:Os04g0166500 [Oryza sativa Japonica Group]|uniref:Os04g0166500 protein n=2 Tax=Oryza sativa TaxID=4530 RepID=A0A0P0W7G0_ORYSJ|nr:hypothetical protein OsI_14811 [Oryza sativa Indica Group]BAS87880.1 Os04g0166500 [Oryza sativa Japonica Group]
MKLWRRRAKKAVAPTQSSAPGASPSWSSAVQLHSSQPTPCHHLRHDANNRPAHGVVHKLCCCTWICALGCLC